MAQKCLLCLFCVFAKQTIITASHFKLLHCCFNRDEDRDILIELKTKGPSRGTFSALSERMNKSPSQVIN